MLLGLGTSGGKNNNKKKYSEPTDTQVVEQGPGGH